MQVCDVRFSAVMVAFNIQAYSEWPLVGNEGMKPYMVMMGIHSLIPY